MKSSGGFSRRMITFERILVAGFINFFRNISLSIAATAVMTVTLSIVLFSMIANTAFNKAIDDINSKIDVSVYLKDSVDQATTEELVDQIQALPNVENVEYISKEDALKKYRQENQDDLDLLLAISQTDNPLPATIRIKPVDPSDIDSIKQFIEADQVKNLQSEETSYSGKRKEAIDEITKATNFYERAFFLGVIVFAVISVLIIFNTIQMAIFNRRDELQIMRLLGASSWFIKGPFIVETMLYGVVAAVASVMFINSLFIVQAQSFKASTFGLLDITFAGEYFASNFWKFFGLAILTGMAIGAISAWIATKKYLRYHMTKQRKLKLK